MKIGELSKVLNLPAETIRYYENEGLIAPVHDSGSKYRKYDSGDVLQLIEIQKYRSMGFSLKEVKTLVLSSTIYEQHNYVDKRCHILEDEITMRNHLLDYVRFCKSEFTSAAYNIGNFWVFRGNASYLLPVTTIHPGGFSPFQQTDEISAWLSTQPYYDITVKFASPQLFGRDNQFPLFLSIDEDYFHLFSLQETENVIYRPSSLCLHTVLPFHSGSLQLIGKAPDFAEYLKQHHLKADGSVSGKLMMTSHEKNQKIVYIEVRMPVTKDRTSQDYGC